MAVTAAPSRDRRRFDPARIATWIRRTTAVCAAALAIWVFTVLGTEWVPRDMDTVPDIPPGSWCVLDRRQSRVAVGSDVFVDVPGLGLVLSRVVELGPDTVTVRHPNAASSVPDSRTFGALPRRCIRGIVRVALPPDTAPRGSRGR